MIDTIEPDPISLTQVHIDQVTAVIAVLRQDRDRELSELERLNVSIAACDIRIGEIDKSIAAFELAHGELRR